jgi:hypothetical protein
MTEEEKAKLRPAPRPKGPSSAERMKEANKKKPGAKRTSNPLEPIGKAIDKVTNEVEWGAKAAGNALGNVIRGAAGKEPVTVQQAEASQRRRKAQGGFQPPSPSTPGVAETKRVLAGVPVRALENVIDTGAAVTDAVRMVGRNFMGVETDPSQNPFHPEYVEPRLNTGVFVPKTAGGKFAQNLVTFGATMSTAWRALPKASGKVGVAIKAEVSSGIADIITTKKGDPNLTGLIKGLLPEELQDNLGLIDYLISDEDDTAASSRVKAILEGSGISAAAAVAIRGLKAARKSYALSTTGEVKSDPDAPVPGKRGKTKSNQDKIEAFQQALRAANEEMTKAADEVAQAATRESELFADITLRSQDDIQARLDEIAVQRQELEEMGDLVPPGKQEDLDAQESVLININRSLDADISTGYTPADYNLLPQERSATFEPVDITDAIKARTGTVSVLTDAQTKLLGLQEGPAARILDAGINRPEVQEFAASRFKSDRENMADALQAERDLLESVTGDDLSALDKPIEAFRKRGLVEQVRQADGVTVEQFNDPGVIVGRTYIKSTAEKAAKLADEVIRLTEEGQPLGNTVDRMIDNLAATLRLTKETSSRAGRRVRMFGLPINRQTGNINLLAKGDEGMDGFDDILQTLKSIQDKWKAGDVEEARQDILAIAASLRASGGNPEKIIPFWQLVRKVGIKDAGSVMINSIFSGPITQLRNISGNAYNVIERPLSSMIYGVTNLDEHSIRASMAGMHGLVMGLGEAFTAGAKALKDPASIKLSGDGKYHVSNAKTDDEIAELIARAKTPSEKAAANFMKLQHRFIAANPLFSWPTRLLTAGDEAFQNLLLRQWSYQESMFVASRDGGNLKEKFDLALGEFNQKIAPDGSILDDDLKEWIAQGTFQGDPFEAVKRFSSFLEAVPVLKWFVPVVNTPSEILRYVGKHTPFLNKAFTKNYAEVAKLAKESKDPEAQAKLAVYEGRVGTGMMMVMGGAMLAATGNLYGYGPPPGSRAKLAWDAAGIRPLTMKVGGKLIDFSSSEPAATILGMTADAVNLAMLGYNDAGHHLGAYAAFTIASGLTDKSFFAGMQAIVEMINPRTSESQREVVLANLINNSLPLSGLRRGIFNTISPYRKEYKNLSDRVWEQASAGMVSTGALSVDPFTGEPGISATGGFFNANSPIRISTPTEDPLKWALSDDGYGFRDFDRGPQSMEMTPEDKNELHRRMFDMGLRDSLEELIQTPEYVELRDSWDRRPYNPDEPSLAPPHIQLIQGRVNSMRRAAQMAMASENEDFRVRLQEAAQMRRNFRQGEYSKRNRETVLQKLTTMPN